MAQTAYLTVPLQLAGLFTIPDVHPELEAYEAGMSVNIIVTIRNNIGYGQFNCQIYDDDTGTYLAGFGDYLEQGQSLAYTILAGTMPTHDWNLRIEVYP